MTTLLYTRDHLGSVWELINATDGFTRARSDYTLYGMRTNKADIARPSGPSAMQMKIIGLISILASIFMTGRVSGIEPSSILDVKRPRGLLTDPDIHPAGFLEELNLQVKGMTAIEKAAFYFLIEDCAVACRKKYNLSYGIRLKGTVVRLAERNFSNLERVYRKVEGEVFLEEFAAAIRESPEFEDLRKTEGFRNYEKKKRPRKKSQ